MRRLPLLILIGVLSVHSAVAQKPEGQRDASELAMELQQEMEALEQLQGRLGRIEEQVEEFEKRQRLRRSLQAAAEEEERPAYVKTKTLEMRRVPAADEPLFNIHSDDATLEEVLSALRSLSGLAIAFHADIGNEYLHKRIWMDLQEVELSEALEILAGLQSLGVVIDENGAVIAPVTALSSKPVDKLLREMAMDAYQRALVRYPGSPDAPAAYLGIARYYRACGFLPAAIEAAENVIKRYDTSPACAQAVLFIGDCHESNGDYKAAREAYRRYMDAYPAAEDLGEVALKIGRTLMSEEIYSLAVPLLEDVIRGCGETDVVIRARLKLAECLLNEGRYDEAMAELSAAERQGKEYKGAEISFMIAECLLRLNKPGLARVRLKDVVEMAESDLLAERAYYMLGDAFHKEGKVLDALEAYRGAAARFPGGVLRDTAPLRFCRVYLDMGLYGEVEQVLAGLPSDKQVPEMAPVVIALMENRLGDIRCETLEAILRDSRWQIDVETDPKSLLIIARALLHERIYEEARDRAERAAVLAADERARAEACKIAGECRRRLDEIERAAMALGGEL